MAPTTHTSRQATATERADPPAVRMSTTDLDAAVRFFVDEIGFAHHLVTPADSPRRVELVGHGLRLDIRRGDVEQPVALVLPVAAGPQRAQPGEVRHGPGGSTVEFVAEAVSDAPVLPPAAQELHISRRHPGDGFGVGRAAMHYRDLLPSRWGGRFIVSHIAIPDGGDLSDWVHYHRIRFQMIYVMSGWVEVVYEDQGPAFRLDAGDCVLQPPTIRHRVLRASPGMEVIEVGCPAEHDTFADRHLVLPSASVEHMRHFGGQRFVRHLRSSSPLDELVGGWQRRTIGFAPATDGLAEAWVAHGGEGAETVFTAGGDAEFVAAVVTAGGVDVAAHTADGTPTRAATGSLRPGDAAFLPAGARLHTTALLAGTEVLFVELAAGAVAIDEHLSTPSR